jgi:NitT/TauT family transport system substrate-binding protein
MILRCMLFSALAAGLMAGGRAAAEVREITIADQFGIAYLPLTVMQDKKLIEKHAQATGLGKLTVTWAKFGGGGSMNDALLSGSIGIGIAGTPSLILLWDRTKGTKNEVLGVCAISNTPMYLNTRDPKIRTLRDVDSADKIALPSVKVSIQAVTLEMAAAQTFGLENYGKLDPLTVSMKHPDAMAALLSGSGEVTSHFASPPFMFQELQRPGIHRVLSSRDVVGEASFAIAYVTGKFYTENPKTVSAVLAATKEAMSLIQANKEEAAGIYVEQAKGKKSDIPSYVTMLNDPDLAFSPAPSGIMKYAEFMRKIGTIKSEPSSWKDMFIAEAHNLPGS